MTERERIEDRAAQWLVRRDDPLWSAADQGDLDAWLDASFAHKAAFWRLEIGWREADRITAVAPAQPPRPRARDLRSALRWALPTALAASLVLAWVVPIWLSHAPDEAPRTAHTGIGETRTITTGDGSRIELNATTVVRTRVLADRRDAWLDRGEAFFDIYHERERPFRVHAGSKTITVLGTRFSVRRDGDRVTVAVVSGRVQIEDEVPPAAWVDAGAIPRSATVGAGDVAMAADRSTLVVADADTRIQELTAWRDGLAVFDQTPLSEAVAEFNRYTGTPIVIDDPVIARFRIGGSFRLKNSEGFLRLLQSAYGLEVRRSAQAVHLSR